MCGIAGFCNNRIDRPALIRAMTDRMRHRGPDAEGFWFDDQSGWTLGHRRLSILDLSAAGSQPMLSASGRYVLSYNGEIYNAPELRDMLLNDGCVSGFRGHSDTEILLEAIEAYGLEETLQLSKGMFALAVYDRQEKVLRLARDRAGEKPLYYGMAQDESGKPFFRPGVSSRFASLSTPGTSLPTGPLRRPRITGRHVLLPEAIRKPRKRWKRF